MFPNALSGDIPSCLSLGLDPIPGPVLRTIQGSFLSFENSRKNPSHLFFYWKSSWPCSTLKIIGEYMVSKILQLCARSEDYSVGRCPSSLLFLLPQQLCWESWYPGSSLLSIWDFPSWIYNQHNSYTKGFHICLAISQTFATWTLGYIHYK